jgi:RecG-like helicase
MAEEFKKRQTAYKISIGMILSSMEAIHFDENQRFKFVELNGRDIYRINLVANVIDKFESNQKPYVSLTLDDGTGNIRVKAFADGIKILQGLQLGDTILLIGVLRFYNDELYVMPEIIKSIEPTWLVARKFELVDEYGQMYETSKAYDGYEAQVQEVPESNRPVQEPSTGPAMSNFQNKEISSFIKPQAVVIQKEKVEEEKIDEIKIGASTPISASTPGSIDMTKPREQGVRDKIFDLIKASDADGGLDIDKIIMALKEPVDQINKEITELLEDGTIYEPKPGRLRVL